MINTEAPVFAEVMLGDLNHGFFRRMGGQGKIFFAIRHGKWIFPFPVRMDGVISNVGSNDIPPPVEVVEAIDGKDLGITEIKWEQ